MLDKLLNWLAFAVFWGTRLFWFLLINAALIGCGFGVGFLLNTLVPSIGLGTGTLIGVFSLAVSFKSYRASMKYVNDAMEKQQEYESKQALDSVEKHLRSNPRIRRTKK